MPAVTRKRATAGDMIHRLPRAKTHCVAALIALVLAMPAMADEDSDLARIPGQTAPAPTQAPESVSSKNVNYVSDAFAAFGRRNNLLVQLPPPTPASWENWLFLDTRDEWRLGPDWRLNYSGRLNVRTSNAIPFPTHENVRNDLRELFVEWQPSESTWLELRRVNIRNGVALGFNPTDYFRPRTVVEALTADPSVLREDRLGSLMLTGQTLWRFGSVTVAYAPGVTRPSPISNIRTEENFDPDLGRTNAEHRFLVKTSLNLSDQFNPELLYYHAGNRSQIGANLTAPIGRSIVAYAEWSGGQRANLITDAIRFGQTTGTLPAAASALLPVDSHARFRSDLSIGASWSTESRLTINLEYHFHEAGFSSGDWSNWFGTAAKRGSIPGVNSALWYIRSYAQDQQEPVSRHAAFVRLDWQDAFVTDLELTALATVNLQDASGFAQATAEYHISRTWTVGGLVSGTYGGKRSEYGSLPGLVTAQLRVNRYF
jgi:hypothetical protein